MKFEKRIFYFVFVVLMLTSLGNNFSQELQLVSADNNDVYNKRSWYENAFEALQNGKYPRIVSESIWSENWPNGRFVPDSELAIDSSPDALSAYKNGISNDVFRTNLIWEARNNTTSDLILAQPQMGIYHNAYPDFTDYEDQVTAQAIQNFMQISGKELGYVYFSNHWRYNISFPMASVQLIHSLGLTPYIRMMPWSEVEQDVPESSYTMQNIINGDFDENLTKWAINANHTGFPIILEFGVEVNGPWFPWNGKWNGGGTLDGYGDPILADGPERFRDAYRHVIDIFRQNNVKNITWVYHVDSGLDSKDSWNTMSAYYPGDDYIDWIGISAYGPQTYKEDWFSFTDVMDQAYPKLTAISSKKPLALLEFGVDENAGTKVQVYATLYGIPIGVSFIIVMIIIIRNKRRK